MRLPLVRSLAAGVLFSVLAPAANCSLAFADQPPAQSTARPEAPAVAVPASQAAIEPVDAHRTRESFKAVLERHPPNLARILRLDPSLLSNDAFLAGYPLLAGFVAQHPEVRQSPGFYLENVYVPSDGPRDPQSRALSLWGDVVGWAVGLTVFLTLTGVLVWLVKTLLNYRRWNRISKVQAEVHTKLLDRFTANDELLAYVQTPAGRRFLESAPIAVEDAPRAMTAPFGRILWSIQAGVVGLAVGIGFQFVSGRAPEEIGQVISLLGVILIALGLGFLVSAGVAYVLSNRLGLLNAPVHGDAPAERITTG